MANALKIPETENEAGSVVIHQLLHGYSEGHRLLERSIEIPEDLTRLLLRLSDLSGSSISSGFEEYITGYPLNSLNAYALAKTWYAPEMPRPGCVWTHTLVVPAKAMSKVAFLGDLRTLFKRPSEHSARSAYGKPLLWEEVPYPEWKNSTQPDVLRAVLAVHYGTENAPILLAARNAKEFEDLVFTVWSQKWPRLRMSFTFCTGALSARLFERRPFEVQCIPVASTRGVLLDLVQAGAVDPVVANSASVEDAEWITEATSDALSINGGAPLRKFVWAVADSSNNRKDFASFISVYDALQKSIQFVDLIALVARLFPSATDGLLLKSVLLGEPKNHDIAFIPRHEEKEALFAIGTTNEYQSFDADALRLKARSSRLCNEAPETATWLLGELFRSTLNPLGEEILAAIISTMEPETARRVTSRQPQFLPALFQAKPSLASSPQLWTAGAGRKRELFEAVATHKDLDSYLIKGIVRALLESGSDGFMRRALDLWGKDAVFEMLDWTGVHDGAMSDTCRDALRLHLPDVMDWVESKSIESFGSFYSVVRIVGPYASKISQRDSLVWLRNFRHLQSQGREGEVILVSAFLLALGLSNSPPSPVELVSESFERVHEAARTDRVSDSAWVIVEPFVPELSWLSNWDKCERLRRGLISAFVKNGWSGSDLTVGIKDSELLRQLVKSARKLPDGEKFVRELSLFA
jgi:hypothetical protein